MTSEATGHNVKGLAFLSVMRALTKVYGEQAASSAVSCMKGEVGEALRLGTIVPPGWYPVSW